MNVKIYCQNCGTVNGSESKYCANCGLAINSDQLQPNQQKQPYTQQVNQWQPIVNVQQPQPRSSNTLCIVIGVLLAICCLPGIMSIVYFVIIPLLAWLFSIVAI